VIFSVLGMLFLLMWRVLGFRFMGHTAHELPGWTTVVAALLLLSGVQLLILGIMGEYIGRMYSEVKQRPRGILKNAVALAPRPVQPAKGGMYDRNVV
jgi:polyisoprenyl-phosphate glycosyltransferase